MERTPPTKWVPLDPEIDFMDPLSRSQYISFQEKDGTILERQRKAYGLIRDRCRRARGNGAETKEAGDRVSEGLAGKPPPSPLAHGRGELGTYPLSQICCTLFSVSVYIRARTCHVASHLSATEGNHEAHNHTAFQFTIDRSKNTSAA